MFEHGDERMTTITDIAKIVGVSKSTVSRYLNGGSVSYETKKKIENIISKTGYTPNAFAQSLKAKKTKENQRKPILLGLLYRALILMLRHEP